MSRELEDYGRDAAAVAAAEEALGESEAFLAFRETLARAARVERPVILVGERGSGKELAATRLHYLSPRWQGPFVALNCAALAPSLLESELFGHEAGAFTGAVSRRLGRFEAADRGTLFLDEIAAMPEAVQEKILRAVEYGVFERVGGSRPVRVDARIVAASNADLPALARAGRFKPDLLDRLSFEVLTLPPLRARGEDILLLARRFAARMAAELGRVAPPAFSAEAEARLLSHPWPGNVRELKNVVERAVSRAEGAAVEEVIFDPFASPFRPGAEPQPAADIAAVAQKSDVDGRFSVAVAEGPPWPRLGPEGLNLGALVTALETDLVGQAMDRAKHNQRQAARLLGLSYDQFRRLRARLAQTD